MTWRDRSHRWFVEYNPLYFASAMCVFAGVWLVSAGLPVDHFASKAAVVGITEAYQLLLILGAWLLLRAGQRRPAALLGLVALLFALDVAFNGERLFSHARTMSLAPGMRARVAVPASLLFAFFGPVKLALLARVFRLKGAGAFVAVAGTAVFLLPLLPYAIEGAGPLDASRRLAHLYVFWLGAPLLGWALARPGWKAEEVDGLRARRIAIAAPFLVAGLFVAHAASWCAFAGLALTPAHGAPYALTVFLLWAARLDGRRAELAAWAGALGAMALSTFGDRPVATMALLTGGALLSLIARSGLRLLLPAIVCVFGGAFLLASGGPPGCAWTLALCAALTAGAAAQRDLRCLVAAGVALGAAVVGFSTSNLPLGLMAGALWVAATSWLIFPELRGWLPGAALALALAADVVPLWREPAPTALWFLGTSLLALGLGFAYRMPLYKAAGTAGLAVLAAATHAMYAPRSMLSWGLLLLAFGFAFLVAGLACNLRAPERHA
ncbi:MAG TPA: hypothetical protein VF950_02905 [Planctomycetota bacterium]